MSHNIFGNRFISLRQAAWHGLGEVVEEEMGAVTALERLGDVLVTIEPLKVDMPDGETVTLDQRVLMRHPTPDDDLYVPFGVVGPEYELITAGDVATVWDEYVAKPVETIGFLAQGATFFVTSKLPGIDVKGDEVEMYIGAVAPMDGKRVASCELWPLRVVCQNTLRAAQARATDVYRVQHDRHARERMGTWLADMYRQAEQNTEVMKEAFSALAGVKVSDTDKRRVLKAAYPDPHPPRQDAPDDVMKRRWEHFNYWKERKQIYRDNADTLFQGAGTGMHLPSTEGTGWGLYNAVAETEDYRRGWNLNGEEAARVGESALFGDRAETKLRAYSALMELVN